MCAAAHVISYQFGSRTALLMAANAWGISSHGVQNHIDTSVYMLCGLVFHKFDSNLGLAKIWAGFFEGP